MALGDRQSARGWSHVKSSGQLLKAEYDPLQFLSQVNFRMHKTIHSDRTLLHSIHVTKLDDFAIQGHCLIPGRARQRFPAVAY